MTALTVRRTFLFKNDADDPVVLMAYGAGFREECRRSGVSRRITQKAAGTARKGLVFAGIDSVLFQQIKWPNPQRYRG